MSERVCREIPKIREPHEFTDEEVQSFKKSDHMGIFSRLDITDEQLRQHMSNIERDLNNLRNQKICAMQTAAHGSTQNKYFIIQEELGMLP